MIQHLIDQTYFDDTTRVVCPFCLNDRKKKNSKDMTLSRKPDGAVVYYCHHCEANGSVQPEKERRLSAVPNPKILSNALSAEHYAFLESRGISKQTADKAKLFSSEKYFAKLGKETTAIGFPYYRDGALLAAKYRSIERSEEHTSELQSH